MKSTEILGDHIIDVFTNNHIYLLMIVALGKMVVSENIKYLIVNKKEIPTKIVNFVFFYYNKHDSWPLPKWQNEMVTTFKLQLHVIKKLK